MINGTITNELVRQINASILYVNSDTEQVLTPNDYIKSFTVERVGDNTKFFGFGICQKVNLKLIDQNRTFTAAAGDVFKILFDDIPTPIFRVTEARRDENTNELSITAYDSIYFTSKYQVSLIQSMEEFNSLTPFGYAMAVTAVMNSKGYNIATIEAVGISENESWDSYAKHDINFEGSETLREALNAIAEATQTIYYLDANDNLIFKRLDVSGNAVLTITKEDYITLNSRTNRRLSAICHTTELGDNVIAEMEQSGTTQYIRDNAFWSLRDNINTLVEKALAAVGGLTINQFDLVWRGNYLLEIGDKIGIISKDNDIILTYLLNDTIEYNGALSQHSQWSYEESEAETAANPSNLGAALKQTYARVDKANKQIDIVTSDITTNSNEITAIRADVESLTATVTNIQGNTETELGEVKNSLTALETQITQTAENVKIEVKEEIRSEGAASVTTSTGFTFDNSGLTIHESGKEVTTNINNNGMTVYKNDIAVLQANEEGVTAVDLHAKTYLLIGDNSRFEDWEKDNTKRTACFWMGGVN